MRPTLIRLVKPRRPERVSDPLYPPLELYKRLLRAHRQLPVDLRTLGDQYVKAEFKAHQKIDNPLHIVGFLTQWQDYLKSISGDEWMEGKLSRQELDKMSPEQVGQLYELMKEAKGTSEQ